MVMAQVSHIIDNSDLKKKQDNNNVNRVEFWFHIHSTLGYNLYALIGTIK